METLFDLDNQYYHNETLVKNPYFIAWLKSFNSPLIVKPFKSYQYIEWISDKHSEFRSTLPNDFNYRNYVNEFCKYLEEANNVQM